MLSAIALESGMSARAALSRLAHHGLWLNSTDVEASEWIQRHVLTGLTFEEAARRLARNPEDFAVAVRRQWFANVLWYSRPIREVLNRCANADPAATLLDVLNLHESDSRPAVPLETAAQATRDSVVLDGNQPIGVGAVQTEGHQPSERRRPRGQSRTPIRGKTGDAEPPNLELETRRQARAWPRLDAPDYVPARTRFEVVVGLGANAQRGVTGSEIVIEVPPGVERIPLTVALIADGVDAPEGWFQPLLVTVDDPTSAVARFRLVGRVPAGPEPVHLTMLEARYIRDGSMLGSASRPLVIGLPTMTALNLPNGVGMPWLAQPPAATPIALQHETTADLTIELAKPDRNAATGTYSCRLYSPHSLSMPSGPYEVDLGEDAKTFAKMIVDQLRQYGDNTIVDNLLQSVGDLVAEKLPPEALDAVTEVASRTAPDPPSVLILSAEPYVPWELARMKTPLDAGRPPYLGAQVLLGRWLQDGQARTREDGNPRPPAEPPSAISVRHMAVMVGKYRADSGLRALPEAEKEGEAIVTAYDAVPLAASLQSLKRLLDADLEHQFERIGGADAVHFAGHGEYDPARQDSSVLFLSDGVPLSSLLFRSAKYGGAQQPLLFLNACMIGIGGQLLGDMGGFPGNCLKGGFGAVLGALWEVDDTAAREIAMEFWRRAMPSPGTAGEPVGAILRDLRSRYLADGSSVPESTYLAYVYYGHPRLTLQRT